MREGEMIMTPKLIATKFKPFSYSQRIHERRMKQAARAEGLVYKSNIIRQVQKNVAVEAPASMKTEPKVKITAKEVAARNISTPKADPEKVINAEKKASSVRRSNAKVTPVKATVAAKKAVLVKKPVVKADPSKEVAKTKKVSTTKKVSLITKAAPKTKPEKAIPAITK
jgi:hypothetical protein